MTRGPYLSSHRIQGEFGVLVAIFQQAIEDFHRCKEGSRHHTSAKNFLFKDVNHPYFTNRVKSRTFTQKSFKRKTSLRNA